MPPHVILMKCTYNTRLCTAFLYIKKAINCVLYNLFLLSVMSWDGTKGVPRFYMFSEDSASAYVLRHQTSTVLEFQMRDRRRFGGSDEEFEGQSMLISD